MGLLFCTALKAQDKNVLANFLAGTPITAVNVNIALLAKAKTGRLFTQAVGHHITEVELPMPAEAGFVSNASTFPNVDESELNDVFPTKKVSIKKPSIALFPAIQQGDIVSSAQPWQMQKQLRKSIAKTLSGFVSASFSGNSVFPRSRAGFSLYSKNSRHFEADAGLRYLHFGSSTKVYTGYFGKFYHRFLLGVRTFVRPASGATPSYSIISRYYVKSTDFISLCVGSGISSDERNLNIPFITEKRITSRLASAGFNHCLSKLNILSVNAAWINQNSGSSFLSNQVELSAGIKRWF